MRKGSWLDSICTQLSGEFVSFQTFSTPSKLLLIQNKQKLHINERVWFDCDTNPVVKSPILDTSTHHSMTKVILEPENCNSSIMHKITNSNSINYNHIISDMFDNFNVYAFNKWQTWLKWKHNSKTSKPTNVTIPVNSNTHLYTCEMSWLYKLTAMLIITQLLLFIFSKCTFLYCYQPIFQFRKFIF